jgi:hypothetical protein
LVASRQQRNPIGWLLLLVALLATIDLIAEGYLDRHLNDLSAPWVTTASWFSNWLWMIAVMSGGIIVPLLFPDGRLLSPRWRYALWLVIGSLLVGVLSAMFKPGPLEGTTVPTPNPLGIEALNFLLTPLRSAADFLTAAMFLLAGYSQVLRFRRSEGEEREQLKWFAFVATIAVFGILVAFLSLFSDSHTSLVIGSIGWATGAFGLVVGLPVAIGIAILRYRLYDIDWIINRTLVYVPLTALLAGVYIAMTGIFRTLLTDSTGTSDATIAFSTIVVVAMLTPAKNYLQERVDRRFKDSSDPARELEKLSEQARSAAELLDHALFLQRFLESSVTALDARGASVQLWSANHSQTFVYGETAPLAIRLSIRHAETDIGYLELAGRRTARPYTAAELAALQRALDGVAILISVRAAHFDLYQPAPAPAQA